MSELLDAIETLRGADAALTAAGPAPFPLPVAGLEAVVAGGFLGVERTDWVFPGLRERVGAVLRGCPVERLVDGHAGARPYRVGPVSASPAARLLHACGVAMARPDEAVLCFIGEGSASYGALHEALNLAALRGLRVIFLASRWPLGEDAPLGPQLAGSLVEIARAHGVEADTVEGEDALDVREAVAAARARSGPSLIEAFLHPGADPTAATRAGELSLMNLTELRALARDAGLRGYTKLKKPELIAALRDNA